MSERPPPPPLELFPPDESEGERVWVHGHWRAQGGLKSGRSSGHVYVEGHWRVKRPRSKPRG